MTTSVAPLWSVTQLSRKSSVLSPNALRPIHLSGGWVERHADVLGEPTPRVDPQVGCHDLVIRKRPRDIRLVTRKERMLLRGNERPVGPGTTSGETEEGLDLEEEAIVNCASVLGRDPGMGYATRKA
jgi:hypothetical protein